MSVSAGVCWPTGSGQGKKRRRISKITFKFDKKLKARIPEHPTIRDACLWSHAEVLDTS